MFDVIKLVYLYSDKKNAQINPFNWINYDSGKSISNEMVL